MRTRKSPRYLAMVVDNKKEIALCLFTNKDEAQSYVDNYYKGYGHPSTKMYVKTIKI